MTETPTAQPKLTLTQQMDIDAYQRSLPLVVAFIALWGSITWFSGFFELYRDVSLICLGLFGGIAIAQLLFCLVQNRLYRAASGLWRTLFFTLTFSSAIIWGGLFAACFFEPSFELMFLPMTLATAGIVNFALSSFSSSRWVAQSYASVLLLPAVFACFSSKDHITMGGMVVVYWFYSLFILQRFHAEYVGSFEKENTFEQQHTELQRQNRTDGLTQVFNRRYFDDAIKKEWRKGIEDGSWLALLFIDIDHFKRINDTYGHMAGDECLIQAAAIINGAVEPGSDIVARYGGEEFAVLLPRTEPAMAERIAESIRRQFSLKEFCFEGGICISITASIGVSSLVPKTNIDPAQLIDEADQGVYAAKGAGRNNVKLYGTFG